MTESPDTPVLEVVDVTKAFPGVIANEDVNFSLHRGQIHCLLGENGAGKSTLMNVVFGLYQPTSGYIKVHGERVSFDSSRDAIAAGIGMVHQHFQLIPVLSVAENVILGDERSRPTKLDIAAARSRVIELSTEYGLEVDPDDLVGDLSVGAQQRVELIKALYRDAEILILDEPTAVLTPGEVDEFFTVVQTLVDAGKSIVFITHKLREVLAVADQVTVLRRGRVVGSADPTTSTTKDLAELMVGREVSFKVDKAAATPGETTLEVERLGVTDERDVITVAGCTFAVRAGEIYGIAGVEGNGQRELVEAIAGMRDISEGRVTIRGTDIVGLTPRKVERLGVGHVPEDRNKHGIVGAFTITQNLVLNSYNRKPFSSGWVMNRDAMEEQAVELVERYDVRTPGTEVPASTLSGGNQQKVVIAREVSRDLNLLIVAQPTRGLDVGSIEFIHSQIVGKRDQGTAVLLVSAELDEILSLADTVGVLYRGHIVAEMPRSEASRERLGVLMAGGDDPGPPTTPTEDIEEIPG
ncbi:ABC transporter ATP-binding protein [Euzebya tangerina]|uniref:ABC transporter ATP-binding protein n=1 Tax=Euzebya tangerina TaxID=591198 RepID=UPI000E3243ED|nr:ABC transporter ATP-binding protein [Euzebya tangerina]